MGERAWWDSSPDQNVLIEISRRADLGTDLHAPVAGRGQATPAGYALMPMVKPGDLVVHYNSRRKAIVGGSVAIGLPQPEAVFWAPRGRSARDAGIEPYWQPGLVVPLDGFTELVPSLSLSDIRRSQDALMRIAADLQARFPGRTYFPWYRYGGPAGDIWTLQWYLAKLPREAVELFPSLRDLLSTVEAQWVRATPKPVSEVAEAEEALDRAAGKSRRSSSGRRLGQGFTTDQEAKVAVEALAMNRAIEHFAADWDVEDVHGYESFDLKCTKGSRELHVEVKGTTTNGETLLLTANEVGHAREFGDVALFVLSGIVLDRSDDGSIEASGGEAHVIQPWLIDADALKPLAYRYSLGPTGVERHG